MYRLSVNDIDQPYFSLNLIYNQYIGEKSPIAKTYTASIRFIL